MYCTDPGPVAAGGGRSRGATPPGWSSYVCTVQILALLLLVGGGAGVPHPLADLVIVCTVQILALLLLVRGGAGVPHPLAGLVMYICTVQILAVLLVVGGGAGVPHPWLV
jgi:hypothetical protein